MTTALLAGAPPRRVRAQRLALGLGLAVVLLALAMLASLLWGTRAIAPDAVWHALTGADATSDEALVVTSLRVPRTILGVIAGAALGTAGALMQAITRNPLAEPGILGVNAGAAAAVAAGIAFAGATAADVYLWFAFAGAGLAAVVVYGVGGVLSDKGSVVRLTLAGAAVTVVLSSFTTALLINFPDAYDRFRFWDVGSIQGRGLDVVWTVTPAIVVGLVLAMSLTGRLNVMALGNELGRSLGANPRTTVIIAAIAVTLLAGGATAAAGPLAFIGLAAPHAARMITGPDHRWLIPYSAVLAAVILLGADVIGRVIAAPAEIETGIMTAIIGGPVFVALARRRRLAAM
ncbi:iron ABC transporter permease [Demequina sp. NBRC 110057]|uniref:FecCD family ABC transporter permease n=1 Tax=Demequina sp. NBRC 110057 TaxID=1570346 RepID=UPI000A06FD2F|nr:iron ABC transporter permease [Demequina sp. NBRC 110057]